MGYFDASLNQVTLIGNIGADISYNDAKTMAYFSLATKETNFDKNTNSKSEKTEWHNIKAIFGSIINALAHVGKGDLIHVSGSIQTYEKDGAKGYYILMKDFTILKRQTKEKEVKTTTSTVEIDDEIPF